MEFSNLARHFPMLLSQEGIMYLLDSPRTKYIVMMLIYVISPVDFLPEAILGPIGAIDDAAVLVTFFRGISGMMINFVREEGQRA